MSKYYPKKINDIEIENKNIFGVVKSVEIKTGLEQAEEIYKFTNLDDAYNDLNMICRSGGDVSEEDKLKANAIKTILWFKEDQLGILLWMVDKVISLKHVQDAVGRLLDDASYYTDDVIVDILTLSTHSKVRYRANIDEKINRDQLKSVINFIKYKETLKPEHYVYLNELPYGRLDHDRTSHRFDNSTEMQILIEKMERLQNQVTSLELDNATIKATADESIRYYREQEEKFLAEREAELSKKREEGIAYLLANGISEEVFNDFNDDGKIDVGDLDSLKKFIDKLKVGKSDLDIDSLLDGLTEEDKMLYAIQALKSQLKYNATDDKKARAEIIREFYWDNISRYDEYTEEGVNEMKKAIMANFSDCNGLTVSVQPAHKSKRWNKEDDVKDKSQIIMKHPLKEGWVLMPSKVKSSIHIIIANHLN